MAGGGQRHRAPVDGIAHAERHTGTDGETRPERAALFLPLPAADGLCHTQSHAARRQSEDTPSAAGLSETVGNGPAARQSDIPAHFRGTEGPPHPADLLHHGAARVGTGGAGHRRRGYGQRGTEGDGQTQQTAHRALRPGTVRRFRGLPARTRGTRTAHHGDVPGRKRKTDDGGAGAGNGEGLSFVGDRAKETDSARIAPHLCHRHAEQRRGHRGGERTIRARKSEHHAGVHAHIVCRTAQGLRKSAPAQQRGMRQGINAILGRYTF